jgi:DNA processing protein
MASQALPAIGSSPQTRSESRLAWLALALTPGLGPTRIARAIALLDNQPARLFSLALTELEALRLPANSVQFLADGRARTAAEQEWKLVDELGGIILTPHDPEYPERLLEIYDPPAVLWVRGNVALLSKPGIAVVGTRSPSPYGAGMAELLSRDLANRRMVILSGMARGIDTAAHKGALDAHGATVAVWGTGLDVIYPKENKKLAEQILQSGGAIVTEFPLGTFPAPQNFPIRNRILSGMSVGVLVVEAAEYSGTRITARCAMEQNRDVYAVPGNVTNKNSWGPNTLIKQGARLTATWEDVWEDLPSQIRRQLEDEQADQLASSGSAPNESKPSGAASLFNEPSPSSPMSDHERRVFARIRHDEPVQLDDLMEQMEAELASPEIFTALFELELAGKVKSLPGKNYVRTF